MGVFQDMPALEIFTKVERMGCELMEGKIK